MFSQMTFKVINIIGDKHFSRELNMTFNIHYTLYSTPLIKTLNIQGKRTSNNMLDIVGTEPVSTKLSPGMWGPRYARRSQRTATVTSLGPLTS